MTDKKTAWCDVCCEQRELKPEGTFKSHKTYLEGGDWSQPYRTCPRSNQKPQKR